MSTVRPVKARISRPSVRSTATIKGRFFRPNDIVSDQGFGMFIICGMLGRSMTVCGDWVSTTPFPLYLQKSTTTNQYEMTIIAVCL